MKKFLCMILALLMVCSLIACDSDSEKDDKDNDEEIVVEEDEEEPEEEETEETEEEEEEPEETTEEPTEEPAESDEDTEILGTVSGQTYTNEAIGIACTLDEDWTILSQEERAEMNGLAANMVSDEDLAELLRESGSLLVFYALTNDGRTVNMSIQDMGILYGTTLDEEYIIEMTIPTLVETLESAGMKDVVATPATVSFLGEDQAGLTVHATYMGLDLFETLVCAQIDNYIVSIAVTSYTEDTTGDTLNMFEGI